MADERDRTVRVIQAGHRSLNSVSWSPDGTRLALGDSAGGVGIWTADGRELWRRVEASTVYHTVWSPDGRRLVSQGDGKLCVWDTAGRVVWQRNIDGSYLSPGWSPDGRLLGFGDERIVRVVDAESGATVRDIAGHTFSVEAVAWFPDGRTLASGSVDATVRVWDASTGDSTLVFREHPKAIWAVAVSPDGERVASASNDGTILVWNARTGVRLARCSADATGVWQVGWSPDGRLVAASKDVNAILIWEAATGLEVARLLGHTGGVRSVQFAPGGGLLASSSDDGTVRVWDVSDLVPPIAPAARSTPLAGYAARQLATVGRRPRAAVAGPPWVPRLPGADGGRLLGVLEGAGRSVAVLPGDRLLASGDKEGQVRLFDLETGGIKWEASPKDRHTLGVVSLRASPDGRRLASSGDHTVRVWDVVTGACLAVCAGADDSLRSVTWSPDGLRVAACTFRNNRAVRVWDARDGTPLATSPDHTSSIVGVDWSPGGRLLGFTDMGRRLNLWDPASGQQVDHWDLPGSTSPNWPFRWSPDGAKLAVGFCDGLVVVCDVHGTTLARYSGHQSDVWGVAWSPDGTLLATTARDSTVRGWNFQTGRELILVTEAEANAARGAGREAYSLSWSPGGGFLAVGHDDHKVRLWDVRDLLPSAPPTAPVTATVTPVPPPLRPLPSALGQAHRAGLHPPLSLVADLLALLAGRVPPELAPLAARPGAAALAALRWPADARTGLALLLLRDALPPPGCDPPPGAGPAAVRDALAAALAASDPCDAEPPAAPLAALARAADRVTPAVLDLLRVAGPRAVAADPALPLRLAAASAAPPAARAAPRRVAGPARGGAPARASAAGSGPRVGLDRVGSLRGLVPSQLALPPDLLAYRHRAGGLLYRSAPAAEEPRPRPVVVVLDVSPAAYGPVEAVTRPAAVRALRAALRAGQPAVAVLAGGSGAVREVRTEADLGAVLSARSGRPAGAASSLRLARALCASVGGGGVEPVVVLLVPSWFGWSEEAPGGGGVRVRGLFVGGAGGSRPAWAGVCDRWACVGGGAGAGEAGRALDHLLG